MGSYQMRGILVSGEMWFSKNDLIKLFHSLKGEAVDSKKLARLIECDFNGTKYDMVTELEK